MKIIKWYMFLLFLSSLNILSQTQTSFIDADLVTRACPGGVCSPCSAGFCPSSFICPPNGTNGGGGTGSSGDCATFCCINTQTLNVTNTLNVTCENVSGNLTVGGSVLVGGSLIVEGESDFKGDVCAEQNLTVADNATIGGDATIAGELDVNGGVFINGPVVINGTGIINGDLIVSLNEVINGNLTVNGSGVIGGLLTAAGGLSVYNGETINNGGLVILSGGANISGDVVINGNETVDDLEVLGNLTVDENAFFNGCNTTVNGTLTTNGPVIMNKGLNIISGNEIIQTGDLTLNVGNLTVGGQSVFNGPVTANNGATINNGLTVFGGQTIATGNLTIANCGNATIGNTLNVTNQIVSPSAATLFSLLLTDTTNSTSPATGALVVNGGVGIAQDLWMGDSIFFQQVTREGGDPDPLNYYEESCFEMTFEYNADTTLVTIQVVRIGNLVNLLIPTMFLDPSAAPDTVHSITQMPERFRPFCIVRGAASTVVNDVSQLGEYEVNPDGNIIIGLPGAALGPQPFASAITVQVDINTITYNRLGCGCTA